MSETLQEKDETATVVAPTKTTTESIKPKDTDVKQVHDADVQDIINMMKNDLNQDKLKSKNDETSLNDCDSSRKSSRTFDNDNYIIATGSNNSDKETLDSSNVNDSNVNESNANEQNVTEDNNQDGKLVMFMIQF